MAREKIDRSEILEGMKKWLDEANSETIVRVFNSELYGDLTYNEEEETYEIDSNSDVVGVADWID